MSKNDGNKKMMMGVKKHDVVLTHDDVKNVHSVTSSCFGWFLMKNTFFWFINDLACDEKGGGSKVSHLGGESDVFSCFFFVFLCFLCG